MMNTQLCKNKEKTNTIVVGPIKMNKKSRLRLTDEEIALLDKFCKDDTTPYMTIKENTGITRNTVVAIIERGWANAQQALALRSFISSLKKIGIV